MCIAQHPVSVHYIVFKTNSWYKEWRAGMSVHQRPKNQTEITTLRQYIVTAPAHGEVSEEIYHRFEYIININKIQSKIYDQHVNDWLTWHTAPPWSHSQKLHSPQRMWGRSFNRGIIFSMGILVSWVQFEDYNHLLWVIKQKYNSKKVNIIYQTRAHLWLICQESRFTSQITGMTIKTKDKNNRYWSNKYNYVSK